MTSLKRLLKGDPAPLGSTPIDGGVNFALFSANAEGIELCVFDSSDSSETARYALTERTGDIWHGLLPNARAGLCYGYRVHGRYDPENGHRFNPNKLLIDPYARAISGEFTWSDLHCGYEVGHALADLSFDDRDNAHLMPKCIVADPQRTEARVTRPQHTSSDSIIYELHVRGYTMRHPSVPEAIRGTLAGLAHPEIVNYIRSLGITAIELLPVHPIAQDRRLASHGLRNYWGYNSVNFFAIERRYLATRGAHEFRSFVEMFHDAGIEVILDVVYNHTGEGDELGPTLSFRGVDNASYYCLAADKRRYVDFTGCHNSLNFDHPRVREMVLDSLRYWAGEMHVDGFRFDLAVTLGRESHHFNPRAKLLKAIGDDPRLAPLKLIAEPWDLAPDGYQLGQFPDGWMEWNDRFRDDLRRFWRGDNGMSGPLATRLAGSSDVFASRGRKPWASVNFVTAHDGFTLQDLVAYNHKHNELNQEDGVDGAGDNLSWNCGHEGPSDDQGVRTLRVCQKRNLIATLLLSQGVPMMLAGDEFGRTQGGNNNAYCQDNEISWIDWDGRSEEDLRFLAFVQRLVNFRKNCSFIRSGEFLRMDGETIEWLAYDGRQMTTPDWVSPYTHCFGLQFAVAAAGERGPRRGLILFNASHAEVTFNLPAASPRCRWEILSNTADENGNGESTLVSPTILLPPRSLLLLQEALISERTSHGSG